MTKYDCTVLTLTYVQWLRTSWYIRSAHCSMHTSVCIHTDRSGMWRHVQSKMALQLKSSGEGLEEEALVTDETRQFSDDEDAVLGPTNTLSLKHKKRKTYVLLGAILCSFLLVAVVAAIATFTLLAVRAGDVDADDKVLQTFTLDQVFNSSLTPKYYHGQWVNQISVPALVQFSSGAIVLYFPLNDSSVTLVPPDIIAAKRITDFKLSPTLKYVLLIGRRQRQYRHSFIARYFIFNTASNTVAGISSPVGSWLQYVEWSPVSDCLAFTAGYSLYVLDVEAGGVAERVGPEGSRDLEQVGVPDWVYEEEMLKSDHAVWWSPGGGNLLYVEFSDIRVPIYSFPWYGPEEDQYPEITHIAYPKSGMPNPNVTVYTSSVSTDKSRTLMPPPSLGIERYIQFGGWVNDTHAYLLWLNRPQNKRIFALYDLSSSQLEPLHPVREIIEKSTAWIDISNNPPLMAVKGTSDLLVIMSTGWDGTADGYLHVGRVDFETQRVGFLTAGDWEATSIIGYSNGGSDVSKSQKCLTCDDSLWKLSRESLPDVPTTCSVFNAVCTSSLAYCILYCYGPAVPYSILVKYENGKFAQVKVLETNEQVLSTAQSLKVSQVKFFTVPADESGPDLYGRMILPPFFHSGKKYPVLVNVYGGPGSQMIRNYNIFTQRWQLFQSAALNCIIVSVDGRGTGFRGDKFKFAVNRQLGNLETVDQIRAGRYLQSLSYVDEDRLAIYGTSFGGYMAAMVGSSGSGVFRASISRSPVVDWRYYDSIYTERYMGTPDANEAGYYNSSVLNRVENLSSVNFLLIHGTGDDNVHFQNSAQLVRALTDAGIQFQVQFYTDKAHSISGSHTRRHLYTLINNFLQSNL